MIKIYGKPSCPFCQKAKDLAERKGLDYIYLTLDVNYTREDLMELVPNARTVPQIFVNETLIGGYNDFETFVNQDGV
jgi:glutaredoxin